jgi:ferritin-like metal-binding protein YciE
MSTLRETFFDELADIYDAEKQLINGLGKMAELAGHKDLKTSLKTHLKETETHLGRLEEIFRVLGETAKIKRCAAMESLLYEAQEITEENKGDAALICAAQKIEHYEIACYGALHSWAELLGEDAATRLLGETLAEEKQADERLTELAETLVNADEGKEQYS